MIGHQPRRIDEEQSDQNEDDQRQQLADRQRIDNGAAQTDPPDIDRGNGDNERGDERRTRPAGGKGGQIKAERRGQHVNDRCPARDPREPHHPADLERGEASECRARIQIWSAGSFETAAYLRKREGDQERRQADCRNHDPAQSAHAGGIQGGLRKHRRTDHLIDPDGRQVPAAEFPSKSRRGLGCRGLTVVHHAQVVS